MRRRDREVPDWQFSSRRTYWWEWLLILLLLGIAGGVRAAPVYKCVGAEGEIAYQQIPCADPASERIVELAPPPAYAKSPEYAIEHPAAAESRAQRPRRGAAIEPTSFECRSGDGQVFYRHSTCPHSITAVAGTTAPAHGTRGGNRAGAGSTTVSARRIPRDEACQAIHAAGSIGRAGHQYDDAVSTYDHNLGRDPCR